LFSGALKRSFHTMKARAPAKSNGDGSEGCLPAGPSLRSGKKREEEDGQKQKAGTGRRGGRAPTPFKKRKGWGTRKGNGPKTIVSVGMPKGATIREAELTPRPMSIVESVRFSASRRKIR